MMMMIIERLPAPLAVILTLHNENTDNSNNNNNNNDNDNDNYYSNNIFFRFFLCPMLMSCWLVHLSHLLPSSKFTILTHLSIIILFQKFH